MGPSFGPLGLGGGVGCLRPVETTKGRLETLLAERSLTDMINGSAGMRVAYLNPFKKLSKNQSPKNMKFDAKRLPKWSRNRCQNASRIDARTGIEKDQENHEKSCFTERVKPSF